MRSIMFMYYLGGNISSALVNLSQPAMMTLPYLGQWGNARAAREIARAAKDAVGKEPGGELGAALLDAAALGLALQVVVLRLELAELPATIERLETEIAAMNQTMTQAGFYQQPREAITQAQAAAAERQARLESAYARWEALEALQEGGAG